jgi:hypothetical protein
MSRFLCTALSVLTAVLLLDGGNLRADEDAAAIIRKAIEAHGGEANLAKLMMCKIDSQGSVELVSGLDGLIEHTFKGELTAKPGKFKTSTRVFQTTAGITVPFASIRTVYNGDGQILINGKSELLKDQALKELKAQAHEREVCLLTPLLKDRKFELTMLDEAAKVSGKAAVALMVRRKGDRDIVLYFDKASGRLVKSKRDFYHIGDKTEGELLNFYNDFKTVQGAVIPHRVVVYHDGKQFAVEKITNIMVLNKVPDSWFEIEE